MTLERGTFARFERKARVQAAAAAVEACCEDEAKALASVFLRAASLAHNFLLNQKELGKHKHG